MAGGSTPASTNAEEGLGIAALATKRAAEGSYGELELSRARSSKQQQLRRSELAGNELEAAAGVRA